MNTKTIKISAVALICSLCTLGTTSCKMSDKNATLTQGTTIGTLIGAGIGAGIGALAGGKNRGAAIAIGAGAGALIGSLAGYRWGASVVKKKEAYASQEAYLNANITQLQNRIAGVDRANSALINEIASLQRTKTANQARIASLQRTVNQGTAYIDQDIRTAKSALASGHASNEAQLRSEITQLEQKRKVMLSNMSRLSSLARKV